MAEDRVARRLGRQSAGFARGHGGARAGVAYLGERGVRIVLVGEDGAWGDLVAPSEEVARRAMELAGVEVREDAAGQLRTGPYEWRRMAGIQLGGR